MFVTGLQFKNYRNLTDGVVQPCEGINVIYGDNAQGKTNLLEAIWLFGGGHSFRGSKENEFIKFGEKFSKLKTSFFSQDRNQNAELTFGGGKKEVIVNGVKKQGSSSLIGRFTAVVFSPEDMTLVKRGPSARRRFIDSAICREKIQNAMTLANYNRTLNQRNALLKDIFRHPELKMMLEIWDENICKLGAQIIVQRLKYITSLSEKASGYHYGISDNNEKLDIKYISTCGAQFGDSENIIAEKLMENMKSNLREDCSSGFTNGGPHRDDFDIIINDRKAKIFASQGQQRSAVLSLKLAEAKVLSEITGENPVVLLDDVLSELDRKRQDFLLNKIDGYQVFITCCGVGEHEALKNGKKFFVKDGGIS